MREPDLTPAATPAIVFDRLQAGDVFDLGEVTVTAEEIVAFARAYDPQPFHLDADAAAASPYGGLIASGWQTCGLFMRAFARGFLNRTISLGSPGIDELRWAQPVRPDDRLTARYELVSVRASASKPDRGIAIGRGSLVHAERGEVLSLVATNLLGRADGPDTAPRT